MMDEISSPRAGAHAVLMPAAQRDEQGDLPLVVWLRGDEPLCAEFTLDAEQVMERLGIRRSRLTQISGKELRVGRMRKGRYVSPVYRDEDVESYLAWTRPTASHQKSSEVLQAAAESLRGQRDVVADRLDAGFEATEIAVEVAVRQGAAQAARQAAESEARIAGIVADAEEALRTTIGLSLARVEALHAKFESVMAVVDRLAVTQAVLAKELAEVGALTRIGREDGKVLSAELAAELAGVRAELADIAAPKSGVLRRRVPRTMRGGSSTVEEVVEPVPTLPTVSPDKLRRRRRRF